MFKVKYPSLFIAGTVLLALLSFSLFKVIFDSKTFKLGSKPPLSKTVETSNITVPERIKNLVYSGLKAYRRAQYDSAKIDLETASFMALVPLEVIPNIALVDSYIVTGDYQRSISLLQELISGDSNNSAFYSKLGLALLLDGKHLEAADSFEHALELDENESMAMLYLGLTYKQMGIDSKMEDMFHRTREQLDQILLINEDDLDALIQKATLNIYWGINQIETKELLLKANALVEKRWNELQVNLMAKFYIPLLEGLFYYQIGKYHESLIKLTLSLQSAPQGIHYDLVRIYYYIGKNYIQLSNKEQAKKFYIRALEIEPSFFYAKEMQRFLQLN